MLIVNSVAPFIIAEMPIEWPGPPPILRRSFYAEAPAKAILYIKFGIGNTVVEVNSIAFLIWRRPLITCSLESSEPGPNFKSGYQVLKAGFSLRDEERDRKAEEEGWNIAHEDLTLGQSLWIKGEWNLASPEAKIFWS